jgi:hypothetical protein
LPPAVHGHKVAGFAQEVHLRPEPRGLQARGVGVLGSARAARGQGVTRVVRAVSCEDDATTEPALVLWLHQIFLVLYYTQE